MTYFDTIARKLATEGLRVSLQESVNLKFEMFIRTDRFVKFYQTRWNVLKQDNANPFLILTDDCHSKMMSLPVWWCHKGPG